MLDRARHFFLRTNSGRAVIVVLAAMGLAYVARIVLVDLPAMEEKERADSGAQMLESMADTLTDLLDERDDVQGELPALTEWYPATVPCAAETTMTRPRDAVWDLLQLPADRPTQFQYRFQFDAPEFKMWARRDSDCDGFYAVWLLEQRGAIAISRDVTAQNIRE